MGSDEQYDDWQEALAQDALAQDARMRPEEIAERKRYEQQTHCLHEWEMPVREVGPAQVDIDGDDYCRLCGIERHEVEPHAPVLASLPF